MNNLIKEYYQSSISKSSSDSDGYVYLILNTISNFYKIGISNNPPRRFAALQNQSGCKIIPVIILKLAAEIDDSDYEIEILLHNYFKDKKIRGEWYSLNHADVSEIIELFWEIHGEYIYESENMGELIEEKVL